MCDSIPYENLFYPLHTVCVLYKNEFLQKLTLGEAATGENATRVQCQAFCTETDFVTHGTQSSKCHSKDDFNHEFKKSGNKNFHGGKTHLYI
jgi:hypothetical protein